jgi:hypothetical protein
MKKPRPTHDRGSACQTIWCRYASGIAGSMAPFSGNHLLRDSSIRRKCKSNKCVENYFQHRASRATGCPQSGSAQARRRGGPTRAALFRPAVGRADFALDGGRPWRNRPIESHSRWCYAVTSDVPASRYLRFRSGFVVISDRPNPLLIATPPQALGLGDTCTTSLRLRNRRFATVEAATRLAWLRSDLAATAGPSLGTSLSQFSVRPHDARARARILVALFVSTDFVHFPEFRVRTVTA